MSLFLALVVFLVIVVGLGVAFVYVILKALAKPTTPSGPPPDLAGAPEVTRQRSAPRRGWGSGRRKETPEQAANTKRQHALARDAETRTRLDFSGSRFDFDIVGESFHQDNLRRLDGGRLAQGETVAFTALVVPDPDNPFSKSGMAVMVAAESVGPIGHFSEDEARRYRAVAEMLLAQGVAVGVCSGWLIGGRDDAPSIGARLSIKSPEEILGTAQEQPRMPRTKASPPPEPEREYAATACPYCGVDLVPPPKAKKKCPSCGQAVFVRSAFDKRRHLLRESNLAAFSAEWDRQKAAQETAEQEGRAADYAKEEAARLEADVARGVLIGDGSLDVEGESRFRTALGRIVGSVEDPAAWVGRDCIARLVRDADHQSGPLVRVEIEGETVGFLSDDDAELYEDLLVRLEREGRPALVRATIRGKGGRYGVTLEDVPDPEP